MMNIALSWLQAGLSGVYVTLELSEELCSLRTDAMLTGMSTKDIRKDIETTELKVKMVGKKSGKYRVKGLPAQSNVNDIRAYLKEYEIKCGKKVDVLLVDYMDLLMPIGKKISAENLFVKDKYVSEELRNLAMEKQCIFVTAAQLNRGAVEEVEYDHSHISGGLSKIQTADNVFGIFTSRNMRERGKYQIQLMKTRSSSGVGQKIDLDFNIDTLRITDPGEAGQTDYSGGDNGSNSRSQSIMNTLQRTSNVSDDPTSGSPVRVPKAQVEGTKLRNLLNNLEV